MSSGTEPSARESEHTLFCRTSTITIVALLTHRAIKRAPTLVGAPEALPPSTGIPKKKPETLS